jgi:DNA-binding transcriptional LysR family regulator
MELMQLEMLVAVAEEHSFLRAAERVFRTQPAVSIGIRKLEGRMGVPLFDRSNRRSGRLTPAGERLYEYARKILGLRDEALSVVKREDRPSEGTLRVGLVGDESLNRFPTLWNWFKERHSGAEVKVHSDGLGTVLEELVDGRLDVALVSGRPRCDGRSKSLVVTRVRDVSGHGWLWVVRQRLGRTPLAHEFEKVLGRNFSPRARVSKPKTIGLSRIRVVR